MNMTPVAAQPSDPEASLTPKQRAHVAATIQAQVMAQVQMAQLGQQNEAARIAQERAALESLRGELRAEVANQVQAATRVPIIRNLQPQAGAIYVGDSGDISNIDLPDEEFDAEMPTPVEPAAPAEPRR